ncbi:MAG: DNA polymerase III subunit beta [Bacteroidaceae bacterium]|nr:DNA polymerase III subunit beta [Bacteroidaceae bacterium]MBQ9175429.1 DNA polymerase III subunit beta [Bacteroidaceae bacterium]MBR1379408.1 DNA polymerase III subunit beta [Bacteroidaceae bacterium]MBR1379913.1 DNA polymerase III subunit beta [Bacteroidaceae bacterium]
MKFSISSTTFCNRLQTLNKVISSKNSLSILESILFDLNGNELKMTASDGDITLITTLPVNEADGSGRFALNAAQIINGLKEISDQPIKLSIGDDDYKVVIKYQNGKCEFVGQSGEEYPMPKGVNDEAESVTIGSDVLLGGISKSLFATADDELRPVMNGIYFDIMPDSITFVASDGHKLVRNRNFKVSEGQESASFILPKKPAKTLKDILLKDEGNAVVKFDDNYAEIIIENYRLSCRLIEGRYPNYNSVIPKDNPFKVRIDRQSFISALRRVLVFANTSTNLIKIRIINGTLVVSSQDIDYSTGAEESIACEYEGNPMNIGFKGTFLIDILNSLTSAEVVLELADPSRAGVIVPAEQEEDEDVLMLLMPMMLNE